MTFTRQLDSETLHPLTVHGPIEAARPITNKTQQLLHSTETVTTYFPTGRRRGEFRLGFGSHSEAVTASDFFSAPSRYLYTAEVYSGGGYEWVDGYYVLVDATRDDSFDTLFDVHEGELQIIKTGAKNVAYELVVPYVEVSA